MRQTPLSTEFHPWSRSSVGRRIIPPDFKFSVRAHRLITHKEKLQPTQKALDTFEKQWSLALEELKTEVATI